MLPQSGLAEHIYESEGPQRYQLYAWSSSNIPKNAQRRAITKYTLSAVLIHSKHKTTDDRL